MTREIRSDIGVETTTVSRKMLAWPRLHLSAPLRRNFELNCAPYGHATPALWGAVVSG